MLPNKMLNHLLVAVWNASNKPLFVTPCFVSKLSSEVGGNLNKKSL